MNFDINTLTIQGRLVRPIDVMKTTKEGKSFAYIHICTNYDWKDDKGEKKTKPTWHSVKVWGVDADNASKYLKKGQQVRVEGYMVSDEQEKDGKKTFYYYPQARRVVYGYEARGEGAEKTGAADAVKKAVEGVKKSDIQLLAEQVAAQQKMIEALLNKKADETQEAAREAAVPAMAEEPVEFVMSDGM
jgi:single-strand DNA-binding protein